MLFLPYCVDNECVYDLVIEGKLTLGYLLVWFCDDLVVYEVASGLFYVVPLNDKMFFSSVLGEVVGCSQWVLWEEFLIQGSFLRE
eukprot:2395896-Rhodomonas_salina.1